MSVTSGDGGGRRRLTGKLAGDDGGAAADYDGGGDFRLRRMDDTRAVGETCVGGCGLIQAPIAARLAATASSRREEHDVGLGCTRFAMVRNI